MTAATRWSISLLGSLLAVLLLPSCTLPPPADPNDALEGKTQLARTYKLPLRRVSDGLNERVRKGEVTEAQAKQIISRYADRVLKDVNVDDVKPEDAWEYGDLFRTARRWKQAKSLLQAAVNHSKKTRNDDRRVNDGLRLAHVLAELGEVANAVDVAEATFDVPDEGAAPILPAVLLEIVPAGEGKGRDVDLARLLEDAIYQHERTVVNPESDSGKAFELARWHHIGKAWSKILELYEKANRPDLLEAAEKRGAKMLESSFRRA